MWHLRAIFYVSVCAVVLGELPDYPLSFGEMKIGAGFYTKNGKYLGGIPKTEDLKTYHVIAGCEDVVMENVTCSKWRADEGKGYKYRRSRHCECTVMTDAAYCSKWLCDEGALSCQCDTENNSGLFCDDWSCRKTKSNDIAREYSCQRTSSSGHNCDAWSGYTSDTEEFRVVACQCLAELDGNHSCLYWECEEMGLPKCGSHSSWCNLRVSLGVGGGLGLAGVVLACYQIGVISRNHVGGHFDGIVYIVVTCIIWCSCWAVGVVIWGGVDGAKYAAIMWSTPIVLLLFVILGVILRDKLLELFSFCRRSFTPPRPPTTRAWKCRGWLVILRARYMKSSNGMVKRSWWKCIISNCGYWSKTKASVGPKSQLKRDGFGGLVERVVLVEEDGIFRKIITFL